ncbi:MAG: bifunctional prephenate dehydrogenase/3-phosphoshikimate 1-carboxyvinyltransferase [Gammaproteobacteria bacterium]|nr:bifunctional prephenate dehydrogenase/3-phosphoshikimate 1-carboxyvinyltransferase [Gammaproteobacteria bacterium]
MPDFVDKTILIIGLGLIGGSLAKALRKSSAKQKLLAIDPDQRSLNSALQDGVINKGCAPDQIQLLAGEADLCVLASPPLTILELIPKLAKCCPSGTVITDAGSVKSYLLASVNSQAEDFANHFVPGHPIAGSEQSGFGAASADLFRGRNTILCPQAHTASEAVAIVNTMWRRTGASVLGMSPSRHDQVLAATSHLPHLLAFAIVDVLQHQEQSDDIFRYAAGGFADFSRVASSDSRMWSDIFVANSEATERVLDDYIVKLKSLKHSIGQQNRTELKHMFDRAKQTRDRFIANHFQQQSKQLAEEAEFGFITEPGGIVQGSIRVPGDKSISHRSIILGALADGVTQVHGFLEGEDALKTVAAFRAMGVTILGPENGDVVIYGVGREGLQAPAEPLDMGNSGTAMRLLSGLLAAQPFDSELFGDDSLNSRPMGRVADPLQSMGATIETQDNGKPPLKIRGRSLKGIHYVMPIASAQVKSSLLLAGLFAEGKTAVDQPAICRDHTERLLQGFGYPVNGGYPGQTVSLCGGHRLRATAIDVPADISSAAFFLVAASIAPQSDLLLEHVGVNPTRIGIINLLRDMGGDISLENERLVGAEPVADIRVRHAPLRGIRVPSDQVSLAIDELPVFLVAAACAEGETLLRDAAELRVKESDRIEAMATGLAALGIELETWEDGIRIRGGPLHCGKVDSLGDHRIAMAFAVAGLRADGPIEILNASKVATSFPGFVETARKLGLKLIVRYDR